MLGYFGGYFGKYWEYIRSTLGYIEGTTKNSQLHKIFKKNNTKLSYSCTPNIEQIISGHNKKVMREYEESINKKTQRRVAIAEGVSGSVQ